MEYGTKVSLVTIALAALLSVAGLSILAQRAVFGLPILLGGLALIGYAYWRRRQVLAILVSGGVTLALAISKGQQVDEFLWYLHAERNKHITRSP